MKHSKNIIPFIKYSWLTLVGFLTWCYFRELFTSQTGMWWALKFRIENAPFESVFILCIIGFIMMRRT